MSAHPPPLFPTLLHYLHHLHTIHLLPFTHSHIHTPNLSYFIPIMAGHHLQSQPNPTINQSFPATNHHHHRTQPYLHPRKQPILIPPNTHHKNQQPPPTQPKFQYQQTASLPKNTLHPGTTQTTKHNTHRQ
jgi:hypothetical protein